MLYGRLGRGRQELELVAERLSGTLIGPSWSHARAEADPTYPYIRTTRTTTSKRGSP